MALAWHRHTYMYVYFKISTKTVACELSMECQEHLEQFWLPESATADSAVSVYLSSSVQCSTSSTDTTCIYMYIVHVIFVIKRYDIYVVYVGIYMFLNDR